MDPLPTTPGEGQNGEFCTALPPKLPNPPAPVPAGAPPRKVKGGAGFARKGAEFCWFLNVGLLCRDYAASPLPGPAWLLRVSSDFSPLCLGFPFPSFLHSPNPRQRRASHAGMLRRPRVGAALLSPRFNSPLQPDFDLCRVPPGHPRSRPRRSRSLVRAGVPASRASPTAFAGSAGGCAQAGVGARAAAPRRSPLLLSASSSGESYWPESAAVAASEVSETLI